MNSPAGGGIMNFFAQVLENLGATKWINTYIKKIPFSFLTEYIQNVLIRLNYHWHLP